MSKSGKGSTSKGAARSVDLGWDETGPNLDSLFERSLSSLGTQPIAEGAAASPADSEPGQITEGARDLPLSLIDHNPYQARQAFSERSLQELADSILLHGVIEPIVVRPTDEPARRFQIVAGERRYRAALLAEQQTIPARIMKLDDTEAAIITTLENLQREDLDIEDEARQFAYVLEKTGMSQRALARKLGIDHRYVMRRVKLLERPDLMQAYRDGRMKLHDAVAMADLQLSDGEPAVELGAAGPAGTSAAQDQETDEFDLVEREDLAGYIVARNGRSLSSAQTGPRGTSAGVGTSVGTSGGRSRFRWRPLQQFYTWMGRTQVADIPPDERATVRAQLTEIKEALEKQLAEFEQITE